MKKRKLSEVKLGGSPQETAGNDEGSLESSSPAAVSRGSILQIIPVGLALSLLTLPGCFFAPGIQKSTIATPASWQQTAISTTTYVTVSSSTASMDQRWWTHFDDPTLDTVLEEALKNNRSLKIAKERVQEARASRGAARSALFPQVNGVGAAFRGNQGLLSNNQVFDYAQVGADASWEIDLFGANQNRTAQASAFYQSAQAEQQAVQVALLAEVARTYFDVRNFQHQVEITKQNLETQRKTVDLIGVQVRGALASEFDVQRAGAQLSTTQAQLPVVEAAYTASLNRLTVLLGYPPGSKDALFVATDTYKPVDPQIVVAAPASVLANRPDVRSAERAFAASISGKRAAISDFFPRISLLGFYGVQTSDAYPSIHPWNVAANVVQPVLNFGRLRSQFKIAKSRQNQAFYQYEQTVLEALENMENSLSYFLREYDRNQALVTSVRQNQKAAELARLQFTNGYTGLLDVLIAQRNVLDAESSLATSDAALRKNLVNIYAAAGGGWDVSGIKDQKAESK